MNRQESAGIDVREWIDDETRHIDVVASWENLCDTYDALRFTDKLSDADRLEEFKWIVQQMNSFLTKMRTKLLSCKDVEAMVDALKASYTPAGKIDLSARRALVYQKLRQRWMGTMIGKMTMVMEQMETEEEDGWQG